VKPVGNGAEVWYTTSSFAPGGAEMVWRGQRGAAFDRQQPPQVEFCFASCTSAR